MVWANSAKTDLHGSRCYLGEGLFLGRGALKAEVLPKRRLQNKSGALTVTSL
jgi:hypothetical protein